MKLFRYGERGGERPGIVGHDGVYRDLACVISDFSEEHFATGFQDLQSIDIDALPPVNQHARIACPVGICRKFIGVGLNYLDHVIETGAKTPDEPVIFMKAISCLSGPYDDIVYPPDATKLDWEVELGVVVGKKGRHVPVERALEHVAGVCIVNDISERSFQLDRGGQWDKGKSYDTFGPVGPWLVTLDEVKRLEDLKLWCELNGERVQDGSTRSMIFDVPFLIHYISNFMTLEPGDIIATGTPAGVGLGRVPPIWLGPGDTVSLGISGLGEQRSSVVPASL